jgi:hypothetical protein
MPTRALLTLFAVIVANQCRIVCSEQRSTWHFAVNDYHGERRLLHRITIQGSSLNQPASSA